MRRSLAALLVLTACAGAQVQKTAVPQNLAAPKGSALKLTARAKGTQNYLCKQKASDESEFEWSFTAPEAELFDDAGQKIGTHFAGPTWQANDGSKLVGEVKEKVPAPDSIPWLLLGVKSFEGQGILSGVTHIQRIETSGGKAPDGGCDSAHAGQEQKVPYTATYLFFAAQGQ